MKVFLQDIAGSSYTFDKTAKTITFSGISTLTLDQILAVVNTTRNIIIYNPSATATGGTIAANVLTLTYDTSAQANTDKLMIILNYPVAIPDGFDVATGATTDAAVVTNTTGTISGKLRGLVKWAFERMPAALGQTTASASLPVVLASDQTAITTALNSSSGTLFSGWGNAVSVNNNGITAGVCTTAATHGLRVGDMVLFNSLASATGGIANSTFYWVVAVGSTTTFSISTTQGGAVATGYGAASGGTVSVGYGTPFDVSKMTSMMLQLGPGLNSPSINFEGSIDGGQTWFAVSMVRISDSILAQNTFSVNEFWLCSVGAMKLFRARQVSYGSGSFTAIAYAVSGSNPNSTIVKTVGTSAISISQNRNDIGDNLNYSTAFGADAVGNQSPMIVLDYVIDGKASGGGLQNQVRVRTPSKFKTATATASGNTAVWTPTSGFKFRIMRYMVMLTSDCATAGGADIDIGLQDSTTDLNLTATCYVPAVGGTAFGNGFSTGWIDLGNGKLSAAANNVLNVNLSAALTAGKVRVIVCGTEE